MKGLMFLSFLLLSYASASNGQDDLSWEDFKMQYGKLYSPEEEDIRKMIYEINLNEIKEHNKAFKNGKVSYKRGINLFGDLLLSEFKNSYLKKDSNVSEIYTKKHLKPYVPQNITVPESFDWREVKVVTKVKSQVACGSCLAFNAANLLEEIKERNKTSENRDVLYKLGELLLKILSEYKPAGKFIKMLERLNESDFCTKYGQKKFFCRSKAPESVHLRQNKVVTEVKNQGKCGSCWAFSATGSLEGQLALKTGKLVPLSEQNLVDCVPGGCHGAFVWEAFEYIIENGGINSNKSYPYETEMGECRFKKDKVVAKVKYYEQIPEGDENALKEAVATKGPISAAMNVDNIKNWEYSGAIYQGPCNSSDLNHEALVVGYGTENGTDYWLIKNSWSVQWGNEGYFKLIRNKDNHCGIASEAFFPIVYV